MPPTPSSSLARLRGSVRLRILAVLLAGLALLAFAALWGGWERPWPQVAAEPARVGVLVSRSGTMAVSEAPLAAAAALAIEAINASGGIAGRRLEMRLGDGRSDPAVFAAEAERLIVEEDVSVLVGCWTSACRKAVRPVVEKHRHLLIYPLQYEGLEQSPNILYTGAAPNQQILPGARWAMNEFGRRVYLLGSDHVFPRVAHRMLADLVESNGGEVVGERFLPLGGHDFGPVLADLDRRQPDVLLNTLNGDSNAAFIAALVDAGLTDLPVLSFSLAEPEMTAWGGGRLSRHYAAWGYFQSIPDARNQAFVAAFKAHAGPDALTSDPIEAVYVGLYLWASAARELGTVEPGRVNSATLLRQTLAAPSGVAAIDAHTRHLWRPLRIGRVEPDGQFRPVYASPRPLRPAPWPSHRNQEEWRQLIGERSGAKP